MKLKPEQVLPGEKIGNARLDPEKGIKKTLQEVVLVPAVAHPREARPKNHRLKAVLLRALRLKAVHLRSPLLGAPHPSVIPLIVVRLWNTPPEISTKRALNRECRQLIPYLQSVCA